MVIFKHRIILIIIALIILASCGRNEKEEMVTSDEESVEVYSRMLTELKEPDGMLEKEKFFAKKAFLEEQTGRIDNAIQSLENALTLNPDVAHYHFRLAKLFLTKGEMDKAYTAANNAIRLGTNSEELLLFVAGLYLEEGNYKEGLYFIDERFATIPESPELLYIRGKLKMGVGDSLSGINDLEKSLEMGNDAAIQDLAILYLDTDPQRCLDFLAKIDSDKELLWLKAQAFENLEQWDSALYNTDKIEAKNNEQYLFYARILEKVGQFTLALENYNILIQRDSLNQAAISELKELERKVAYLRTINRQKSDTVSNVSDNIVNTDSTNFNE